MRIPIFQVDAFANQCFTGNPAAVCPLETWLDDAVMQSIAAENNLSETAFFVETDKGFQIRWFTPTHEIALCGHATLASAFVLFELLGYVQEKIVFESKSGPLTVSKKGDWFDMDFPSQPPVPCETPAEILQAFASMPIQCLKAEDYIVVFENEADVLNASPDLALLSKMDLRCVVITAKSSKYDFVTRVFAPKFGINEDPVTGSAFTQLIPYWESVLNKQVLGAKQVSQRGGEVHGAMLGERVIISGQAALYLMGQIEV